MVVVVVGMILFKKCWPCSMLVLGVSIGAVGGANCWKRMWVDVLEVGVVRRDVVTCWEYLFGVEVTPSKISWAA